MNEVREWSYRPVGFLDDVRRVSDKDWPSPPAAAVVEIVERGLRTDHTTGGSIVVPDQIRVNGMPLLVEPNITIAKLGDREAARVTITLYARRIVVAGENDLEPAPDL